MPKRSLASLSGTTQERPDPTKSSPEKQVEKVDRKMTFQEREMLRHEIEMTERSMNQDIKQADDPRAKKELYRKKMLLAHDDELTFQGNDKELAYHELKEIEKVIVPEMPTKNEMWPKNDISLKAQALRHQQAFEKKFNDPNSGSETGGLVLRWQELKRRLEPDNPHAQNLDNIRPD
jgi:hypothetical protein